MRLAKQVVGVMGVVLACGMIQPVRAASKAEEPVLQVSEEELREEVGELERGGNFGPFHLFGYGELHYNNRIRANGDEIDFHRLVLGLGYDFNENILFRSELDFEHAFKEPELEYAYVDFLLNRPLNFRAGSILVPMGVINQHHEPPLFYSVERPELYRVIIPTSWQEGGAGLYGKLPAGFDYELYALSSLNAADFRGSSGVRRGRGHVGESPAQDFAGAARVQYKGVPGLRIGSSAFLGRTGQGTAGIGDALLTMIEGDAKYSLEGIDLEGTLAYAGLGDAANINNRLAAQTPAVTDLVGTRMLGWYLEGAYHLFHHLMPDTRKDLVLFSRYEKFDTQFRMVPGTAANPANDRQTITSGISYLPIPQVALKADYMYNKNQAKTGVDQFNLGVGFYY